MKLAKIVTGEMNVVHVSNIYSSDHVIAWNGSQIGIIKRDCKRRFYLEWPNERTYPADITVEAPIAIRYDTFEELITKEMASGFAFYCAC